MVRASAIELVRIGRDGETIEQVDVEGFAQTADGQRCGDLRGSEAEISHSEGAADEDQAGGGGKEGLLDQTRRVVSGERGRAFGNGKGGEVVAGLVDQQGSQHDLAVGLDRAADEGGDCATVVKQRAEWNDVAGQCSAGARGGSDGFQSGTERCRRSRNWCARTPMAVVSSIGQAHIWSNTA